MSSLRSRCALVFGLALTGCASPGQDVGRLLWPDQFHLTYENGDGESQLPNGNTVDNERDALLVGLSWDISPRNGISRDDLMLLIQELRQPAPQAQVEEASEVKTSEAAAPIEEPPVELPAEPAPEPELVAVVAEELAPEPVAEEPAPVEVVAEVVPEVVEEPAPEEVLAEATPVEATPVEVLSPEETLTADIVAESVSPDAQKVAREEPPRAVAPVEPAREAPAASAPIVESEGRTLYGVVLVAAIGVLVLALAIRFLPGLRAAR